MLDPCLARPVDVSGRGRPTDPGARTLRERQGGLRAAIDRAPDAPEVVAARRLVSVYSGGNMPTQPNHVFLAHPAELDSNEAEGGLATPDVDTSTTIPVVVLWHVPQAGDLLVATSVGGRWVAERGGGGQTKICISACGNLSLAGATISVLSGSTVVASCTTDPTGCCSLPISGTYTVQVTYNGTLVYSGTRTLPPGGTTTIAIPAPAGFVCCGGYLIPQILTLTDAAGSITFAYDPNYGVPLWTGGHSVQRTSCSITTPEDICIANPPSQGPVRVCYQMVCRSGQNPTFAVQRSWSWVYQQGTPVPIWYQDPSGFAPGQFCVTAPPPICGNPLTDTASFGANPTTGSPFVLTGTPAPSLNNATGDPVGGSIAITP